MQSNLLKSTLSVYEQPVINGHEMLVFETDIAWNSIKGWVLNQYLNNKEILVYDAEVVNKAFTDSIDSFDDDNVFLQDFLQYHSISNLLKLMDQKKLEEIREILRDYIWESIRKDYILGVSFLFNFNENFLNDMALVLRFERILNELFQNRFGFPIDCCCLYPSSIDVLDFAELVDLHNGYQIFDRNQRPRLQHHTFKDSKESWSIDEIELENSNDSSMFSDSLSSIAKRALSNSNSPFFFQKGTSVVGVANNLVSFYEQLSEIPLDVFCFHSFRMSRSNLSGKSISPSRRSDIALWIEYSIGDTQLAHRIYNTIHDSLGERIKTLSSASRFTQLTARSAILKLIKARIDFLSFGDFK